jgi:hypothetical protein
MLKATFVALVEMPLASFAVVDPGTIYCASWLAWAAFTSQLLQRVECVLASSCKDDLCRQKMSFANFVWLSLGEMSLREELDFNMFD